ncbi:DnaJ domain-containing protein [Planoprotostelium fungivorum]|uniref:DnaJ domain-containing protein n=1 Tax=Planoprotostelium fungivorum TaxID=1890364 RepID=A0A2P6P0U3_9EUKA|nr:DnaJ domain-containing protein [Planoprotostelium fungivorum]
MFPLGRLQIPFRQFLSAKPIPRQANSFARPQLGGRSFHTTVFSRAKDPYDILGVSRTATDVEIRKAFFAIAKLYHPDVKSDDPKAGEKYKQASEAYEVKGIHIYIITDDITKVLKGSPRDGSGPKKQTAAKNPEEPLWEEDEIFFEYQKPRQAAQGKFWYQYANQGYSWGQAKRGRSGYPNPFQTEAHHTDPFYDSRAARRDEARERAREKKEKVEAREKEKIERERMRAAHRAHQETKEELDRQERERRKAESSGRPNASAGPERKSGAKAKKPNDVPPPGYKRVRMKQWDDKMGWITTEAYDPRPKRPQPRRPDPQMYYEQGGYYDEFNMPPEVLLQFMMNMGPGMGGMGGMGGGGGRRRKRR